MTPSSAQKKKPLTRENTEHYTHVHAFVEVNKLFKTLIITADVQNASLLI
jgi:hypothetical protein